MTELNTKNFTQIGIREHTLINRFTSTKRLRGNTVLTATKHQSRYFLDSQESPRKGIQSANEKKNIYRQNDSDERILPLEAHGRKVAFLKNCSNIMQHQNITLVKMHEMWLSSRPLSLA